MIAGQRVTLTSTVLSLLSAALLYLCGAFAAASFDITTWDPLGRAMLAFGWLALNGLVVSWVAIFESDRP